MSLRRATGRLTPFSAAHTFEPDGHQYTIGGIRVPSVTQVLTDERFVDFSNVPDRTLEQARARGTYVHRVLHAYLEDDFDIDDCDPRFRGYVDSALTYLAELKKRPLRNDAGQAIAVEYRFWHQPRMFAGCVDYVGWDPDEILSIDDWKTGQPHDVAAALQTAAYECGLRECLFPTLTPPYRGVVRRRAVKLFADGRPGRPEPYHDPRDLSTFLAALSCVHYRRNTLHHTDAQWETGYA